MPRKKAATPTKSTTRKSHTVQPGETLSDVARALGVTEDRLREVNGLRHDLLAQGTTLKS